jgi:DNA-binding transcriptional regulator YdaS (Cro superfamily)
MTDIDKLSKLVDELGGRKRVARALDVTNVALHYWLTGKEPLPLARALRLAQLSVTTGTPVSVYDLRPDLRVI